MRKLFAEFLLRRAVMLLVPDLKTIMIKYHYVGLRIKSVEVIPDGVEKNPVASSAG